MKKRLLLLPLTALMLTGCKITLFGKTFYLFEKNPEGGGTDTLPENFLMEFENYKMATKVKDGGKYILATYRINEEKVRIFNGDYHKDSKGSYPFYLGTSEDSSLAAEVEIKFTGKDTFAMQVHAPTQPWDGKYIGVYAAQSGYQNEVMSIALLDDPDQETYQVPIGSDTKTYYPKGQWKFYEKYDNLPAFSPAALYKHEQVGDVEAVPKFLGTGHNQKAGEPDYTSMDCKSYEVALQNDAYDLAHLYEKK